MIRTLGLAITFIFLSFPTHALITHVGQGTLRVQARAGTKYYSNVNGEIVEVPSNTQPGVNAADVPDSC